MAVGRWGNRVQSQVSDTEWSITVPGKSGSTIVSLRADDDADRDRWVDALRRHVTTSHDGGMLEDAGAPSQGREAATPPTLAMEQLAAAARGEVKASGDGKGANALAVVTEDTSDSVVDVDAVDTTTPTTRTRTSVCKRSGFRRSVFVPQTAQEVTMGMLWKKGSTGLKRWQKRFFVLQNHYLVYYQDETAMDKPWQASTFMVWWTYSWCVFGVWKFCAGANLFRQWTQRSRFWPHSRINNGKQYGKAV